MTGSAQGLDEPSRLFVVRSMGVALAQDYQCEE